jgi:hypothetical protein
MRSGGTIGRARSRRRKRGGGGRGRGERSSLNWCEKCPTKDGRPWRRRRCRSSNPTPRRAEAATAAHAVTVAVGRYRSKWPTRRMKRLIFPSPLLPPPPADHSRRLPTLQPALKAVQLSLLARTAGGNGTPSVDLLLHRLPFLPVLALDHLLHPRRSHMPPTM